MYGDRCPSLILEKDVERTSDRLRIRIAFSFPYLSILYLILQSPDSSSGAFYPSSFPSLSLLGSPAFPFLLRDDRDPEGYAPPSLPLISSAEILHETREKRLEDAQGITSILHHFTTQIPQHLFVWLSLPQLGTCISQSFFNPSNVWICG